MKHIVKKPSNEPTSLREYRDTTPNPNYNDASKADIREALLEEQGGLCAYCMKRISNDFVRNDASNKGGKPKMEIEHFKPQESYPELSLQYNNMLGVCNGASHTHPENERFLHCDKTAGKEDKVNGTVELKRLNPLRRQDSDDLLSYSPNGKVYSKSELEEVTHDLEIALNLNNPALIKQRRAILDVAKSELLKEQPIRQWEVKLFNKHINHWKSRIARGNNFRQFCMVAVDFLEKLKQKSKYQR